METNKGSEACRGAKTRLAMTELRRLPCPCHLLLANGPAMTKSMIENNIITMKTKIQKLIIFTAFLCSSLVTTNIFAADLLEVYDQARINDPKLKAARSEWLAVKEDIAINRASLLPQLEAAGSLTRRRTDTDSFNIFGANYSNTAQYNNNVGYSLKLAQSIFNFSNWANVWKAKAQDKSAHAKFLSAEEDLLLRVSQAYFTVLLSKNILHYAKTNKETNKRFSVQAKHKHDVGLIPITDLEEARTKYALATAEEIKAKNNLDDSFEKLSEITRVRFHNLEPLKNGLPLLSPEPANIEAWAKIAEQQNFSLLSARYNTIAARENVKVQNGGHLPRLDLQASHEYAFNDRNKTRQKVTTGTLGVTIPLFQGGAVFASAKKAGYQYQQASHIQEETHRSIVSQTRQNYLGVLSNISKIKADRQAIKSAKSSLRANRASYSVGVRTMLDVLTAQSELFGTQKTYAEDEYNYIIQFLKLKELTGSLDVKDLVEINSWLKKPALKNNYKKTKKPISKKNKSQKQTKAKVDNQKIVVINSKKMHKFN